MKALTKRVAALTMALAMVLTGFFAITNTADAANNTTLTTSAQVADLVWDGYNQGVDGPISIIQGTLKSGWSSTNVYLVTLSGTEDVKGQSTGYLTDLLSGFNLKSAYYDNVVAVISNNIPANSNIILAGHSLGGMIAQQVAANSTIKANYNILNTVCFGSPLLSAGSREGTVKRLGDTSDVVPYLSGSMFNNTIWAVAGLNRENGGYGWSAVDAHCESYLRDDVWGAYDVTGAKNGGAKLTLNLDSRVFFQSEAWV